MTNTPSSPLPTAKPAAAAEENAPGGSPLISQGPTVAGDSDPHARPPNAPGGSPLISQGPQDPEPDLKSGL